MQLCIHDSLTTKSDMETFLPDFLVILKRMLQNYEKILNKRRNVV